MGGNPNGMRKNRKLGPLGVSREGEGQDAEWTILERSKEVGGGRKNGSRKKIKKE